MAGILDSRTSLNKEGVIWKHHRMFSRAQAPRKGRRNTEVLGNKQEEGCHGRELLCVECGASCLCEVVGFLGPALEQHGDPGSPGTLTFYSAMKKKVNSQAEPD